MALYLPDQNLLILHLPRTGGTWIKGALSSWGVAFEPAEGLGEHNLPEAYEHPRAHRAVFVRHPIAWLESVWRGCHASWPSRKESTALMRERYWSPMRVLSNLVSEPEFIWFQKRIVEEQPGLVSRMVEWFVGPPGWPKVDFVGRQEHLAAHLEQLLRRYGWAGAVKEVPRIGVGENPAPDWNDDLKARVLAAEQPMLRRFYSDPENHSPAWTGEVW